MNLPREFGGISKKIVFVFIYLRGNLIPPFFILFMKGKLTIVLIVFFNITMAQDKVFELMSSDYTGIHFNNQIQDQKDHNILLYANYYGGAGVGIADFDNDGFQDVYLAGNLVGDKIYQNKGNLKFKKRFIFIEQELKKRNKSIYDSTIEEMDSLWNKSKDKN